MSTRASEILLLALLVVIVGFTRVYYGGAEGPMFVWKGEFGFKDTFVNLSDIERMPPREATAEHPAVLFQLEEMGLLENHASPRFHAPRRRGQAPRNGPHDKVNEPTPSAVSPGSEKPAAAAPAPAPTAAPTPPNH